MEKKVSVHRNVSFKKLDNWSANRTASGAEDQQHKSSDSDGSALPPPVSAPPPAPDPQTAVEKAQPSAAPRKVSKISAAGLRSADLHKGSPHAVSPSIRQLSVRFNRSSDVDTRLEGAQLSRRIPRADAGYLAAPDAEFVATLADGVPEQSCSSCDPVPGSYPERTQRPTTDSTADTVRGGGKRDPLQVPAAPRDPKSLNSGRDAFAAGTAPCRAHRGYFSTHGELFHVDLTNWPSVPKIRELFGDSNRKKYRSTSDGDEPKPASHWGPGVQDTFRPDHREGQTSRVHIRQEDNGPDLNAPSAKGGEHLLSCFRSQYQGLNSHFKTRHYSDEGPDPHETREESRGPKPVPPAPPPRSSSVAPRLPSCVLSPGRQQHPQEQTQPLDSLHSSHSSCKPQAAPSVAPAHSGPSSGEEGEEEEGCSRGSRGSHSYGRAGAAVSFSRNKNGTRARSPGRSSGSEEDSPVPVSPGRDNSRRRSLRRKKRSNSGAGPTKDYGQSDDSDGVPVMEPGKRFQPPGDGEHVGWRSDRPKSRHCLSGQPWERPGRLYRGVSDGVTPTPVPVVSRVSKVSIPSFSPCGSRSSSRYSSTETLKDEDHSSAAGGTSGTCKAFHGNFTMYRSPSLGYGDNFPRTRVWSRPLLTTGGGENTASETWGLRRGLSSEKEKQRMSMSNPDITSETLSLLSFLKTDLSELKVRKKGRVGADQNEDGCRLNSAASPVYKMGARSQGSAQGRLSLKDLTATLRRAKSFTYSDKPLGRRYFPGVTAKRSNSEQHLDIPGDGEALVPDREVQSDDCQRDYDYEEQMPTPLQDQYIQEARQVIRDICQMGARDEDLFGMDREDDENFRRKDDEEKEEQDERRSGDVAEKDTAMSVSGEMQDGEKLSGKGGSDENVFYDKSMDESSGHESSLTDEGIVTEPETGSCRASSGTDLLGQTLTAWSQSGLYQEGPPELKPEKIVPTPAVRTEYEAVAIVSEPGPHKDTSPGPLETPSTPSTLRRRRKFSSTGTNGSDSSNGSNGESNGEAYRSLSDPMPHRQRSVPEDAENFSVDSNLLGSLNAKAGIQAPWEGTGSAASDLSVCSESPRDYSTLLRSIVHEPGAMDKLGDDKANGKAGKKKSFSDPSRRGEPAGSDGLGFVDSSEPISELEQAIPPSSSEPILSEQRDELAELGERRHHRADGKAWPHSEHVPPPAPEPAPTGAAPCLPFDPKLAEVLSPRMARRSYKKRGSRVPAAPPRQTSDPEQSSTPRGKHVRHASEPATFTPIVAPEGPPVPHHSVPISVPTPTRPKLYPAEQTPSLEDVTKQYILALNVTETPAGPSIEGSGSLPGTPTTGEPKPRKAAEDLAPGPQKTGEDLAPGPQKAKVDMRKHVVMTLLDTEQSYVESLRTLIQGYMKPLKHPEHSPLCDPSLVDEMFYQVPEILEHHEQFLERVVDCVNDWHDRQTVGHLLVESFSKEILVNIYSAYIDNFLIAKDAVRIAKEAKPAFLKFLEQSMRENKEKQALGDLMIKPVQRIPRYELLVKDLLKHTPEDHPDHSYLLDAQKNIKCLAERINKGRRNAEEAEREARVMQEIEAHIEGVEHILNPHRKFLRQEMVIEAKTVGGKKDRSLFLFSDLLICTTLKRKSGSLRRSSMSLYSAASVIDTSSKYKFLWKLSLEDVEMVKGSSQSTNRENIQKTISRLDEDLSTLGQISKLSETLSFPHQSLDDVIKDLMASVHRELAEKQSLAFSSTFLPTKLELTTVSAESTFIFEFTSPDARSGFEQTLEDAKKKLAAMNKDHWDPEFLKAIPIMKTRSGMQFSCASPSHSLPESPCEVWVCNSDGYVGQVCLLNIREEPTVEACIAVCSARIVCIAAVPGLKGRERTESIPSAPPPDPTPSAQQQLHISISGSSLELMGPPGGAGQELMPFDSDDTDDEDSPSPSSTLQSQASHSTISSSFGNDEGAGSKDMVTETTSSEEEQEFPVPSPYGGAVLSVDGSVDGRAMRRSSRGSFTRASLDDLLSIDPEAYQSSVWLGTEDGCIHVYQSSDNIRNRKNSMKMQHAASILSILYLDNKVFVSLANGEVIVYQREAGSFWDPQSSQTLCLGTPGGPVTKMVPVAGKLWCGCQNRILIVNTNTLTQEHSFQVGQDSSRCVTSMVSYGQGVWIALQGSAQVRLYHAPTCECLTEVDVAPAVHKMLAGSDAIIRQHKAACLRITALLACKDLLWVGTSAGVVLTLAIPPVSASGGSSSLRGPLTPMGSAHGHTGHVRFLTAIELPEGFDLCFPPQPESANPTQSGNSGGSGLQRRDSARRRTSASLPAKSNLLVISGGDGYEDFRLTNSSETVGRDDSTNHLLLWRV
nr:rho guanine nucleotide exchange factor 17 isoform X2 [Paramormyrops kingsleyae]